MPFDSSHRSARATLPLAIRLADLIGTVVLLLAAVVFATGGFRIHALGVRFSVGSPWRAFALGLAVLVVRHVLAPTPPIWARLIGTEGDADERKLFDGTGRSWSKAAREFGAIVSAFAALVAVVTWPQIRRLDALPDLGDPLFSVWRLAWVAHQLVRDPRHLFDANIFYPEHLTFAYSDSVLAPSLAVAPLAWLGVHPLTVYNLLLLSAFALSGATMFLLVRALTGRRDAAAVAGVIFAIYPYRFEHYHHLELQMTATMPLVLWGLHRTIARAKWSDGIGTGVAYAVQMLSSMYYGVYFAVYLIPVGAVLWLARSAPRRPLLPLAAGAVLAAMLMAPLAAEYIAVRPVFGERHPVVIQNYSATPGDYLVPNARSWWYSRWSADGHSERQLFPGVLPVVLTAVALWPPLSPVRIAYAAGLALALDGSMGFNGLTYPWLHAHVGVFRGLRVPSRFAVLVGLTLAILSGFGAARVFAWRPRWRVPVTTAMLVLAVVEPWPLLNLESVWREPPPIYAASDPSRSPVVAEFPMEPNLDLSDTRYLYFSVFHWWTLVNGYSGYSPLSHLATLQQVDRFPDDHALWYLRRLGVEYLTVHGAFYPEERFRQIVAALDARKDLELVVAAPWQGSESRLYRFRGGGP